MIIFYNDGLIPLDAFRLMGASVKMPGSFGRFGTGLKHGLACILRGGGDVVIWRGNQRLTFELRDVEMRGTVFQEVVLVNPGAERVEDCHVPLGFTVELGRDWEPWMVLRELACNARDEGGDFNQVHPDDVAGWDFNRVEEAGETVVIVDWAALDLAAEDGSVFASGEVLCEEAGVRVLAGPSKYLYHRGVRVWELPKPSVFTYDVLQNVDLTEDRTVKYSFCVVANIRNLLLRTEDRSLIAAAVTAGKEQWEGSFDWTGAQWEPKEPGTAWLEEVSVLRAAKATVSKSAMDVYMSHAAYQTTTRYVGGSYDEPTGTFGGAVEELGELGVDITEVNVFVADELPGEALSSIKGGSAYVSKALLERPRYEVAREVLARWLELRSSGNYDRLLALVVPLLLDQSYTLKQEREVIEAHEAGLRPTMAESFLGLHPVLPVPDISASAPDF